MGNLHLHVVVGTNKQWVYNNMGQILKKTNIEDPILQLENVQSLFK
jgi:phosphotransferase system IIB component